ncbi:MAG TPA: HAD family hydrolase [Actinomycetota bacterium]|nr:HAD family hydrolase [Actinomycetota bacterium]
MRFGRSSEGYEEHVERGQRRVGAVLFDRDGTLIEDVPYNAEPARVVPRPGARSAIELLRGAGLALGVVTNQSGIGRGLVDAAAVARVNRRVEELLGPFGVWAICPHHPEAGCGCRKPAPGLVLRAAEALGRAPEECVVVGDTWADVGAALAAGAGGILVPNDRTRPEELRMAPEVRASLTEAAQAIVARLRPLATEGRR